MTETAKHALWHPFADMGAVDQGRMVFERAEGAWVWDQDGTRYFDGTAALWYSNLGHGRSEIAEAVHRQLETLDAYAIFGDYANAPALQLADRIAALAPQPDSRIFLGSGGGDMIETAAKIARQYHSLNGQPDRLHLIGRTGGYHGTHGIGTSVGGIPINAVGFGRLISDVSSVAYDDPQALEVEIERLGADRVAAFFCEPVIGGGGVLLPPDGYIEAVADICRRHGVLFVADCVICGFGRLGTWFGIDRWPVKPDFITLAKGISGGTLPIGALIVAPQIAEPFFDDGSDTPILRHGPTYAGHPTCCAAANAALDIYEREGLIERGRELERPLAEALAPLSDKSSVAEIRCGLGLLAGVDLSDEILARNPDAPGRWQRACRDAGVIVRSLERGIALSPPLICTEDDLDTLARGVTEGLKSVESALVGTSPR